MNLDQTLNERLLTRWLYEARRPKKPIWRLENGKMRDFSPADGFSRKANCPWHSLSSKCSRREQAYSCHANFRPVSIRDVKDVRED
jgi:hypothetical protein